MLCGRAGKRETDKTSEVSEKKEKSTPNADPPAQHLRPSFSLRLTRVHRLAEEGSLRKAGAVS